MTDESKPRLRGVVPLPPAMVLDVPYYVQPGDTVESITGKFTRPDAWPGLVGANVHHKTLADAEGQQYAVFKELRVGEPLLIPATWRPQSTGVLGAPFDKIVSGSATPLDPAVTIDPTSMLVSLIVGSWDALLAAIQFFYPVPSPGVPWSVPINPRTKAPYTPNDIAQVVAGWIPYFAKMPAGLPANVVLPPVLPPNPVQWPGPVTNGMPNLLVVAAKQAAELLGATGVANGNVLARVPWDTIPWGQFPWATVNKDDCWALYQAALQKTGSVPMKKVNAWGQAPMFEPPNYTPSLLTEKWDKPPWTAVPWSQINWPGVDPTIFQDQTVQTCMADPGAAARLQQMVAYKDCFVGQGAAKFAKYLCPKPGGGGYEDLASCAQAAPPPLPCQGNAVLVNGVCVDPNAQVPPWFPTVNWNCQPFPMCVADQVPPAQRPCDPWPDCFGAYLESLGVQPPAQPPAEPAKAGMSTGAKVAIGVAATGAMLLIGSIIVKQRE
jgi:hypothetical protein